MPANVAGAGPGGVTDLGSGVQQCGGATVPSVTATAAESAQALFSKGMTGPFVAEAITAPGDAVCIRDRARSPSR